MQLLCKGECALLSVMKVGLAGSLPSAGGGLTVYRLIFLFASLINCPGGWRFDHGWLALQGDRELDVPIN